MLPNAVVHTTFTSPPSTAKSRSRLVVCLRVHTVPGRRGPALAPRDPERVESTVTPAAVATLDRLRKQFPELAWLSH
jgi:hypothetical protein